MSDWIVYSRPGCGLCEEFMAELALLVGPAADQIRVIDIDHDPALQSKYGARIPVLTIDGDFVCGFRVDRARVRKYLDD